MPDPTEAVDWIKNHKSQAALAGIGITIGIGWRYLKSRKTPSSAASYLTPNVLVGSPYGTTLSLGGIADSGGAGGAGAGTTQQGTGTSGQATTGSTTPIIMPLPSLPPLPALPQEVAGPNGTLLQPQPGNAANETQPWQQAAGLAPAPIGETANPVVVQNQLIGEQFTGVIPSWEKFSGGWPTNYGWRTKFAA